MQTIQTATIKLLASRGVPSTILVTAAKSRGRGATVCFSSSMSMRIVRMSMQSSATAAAAVAAASTPLGAAAMSMSLPTTTKTTISTNAGQTQSCQDVDVLSTTATNNTSPSSLSLPPSWTPTFRWCRTAFINKRVDRSTNKNEVQIEKIASDYDNEENEQHKKTNSWLKVIIQQQNQQHQEPKEEAEGSAEQNPNRYMKVFDVTQSNDWMEYIEHVENRFYDEGGAGAYDTMRCDIVLKPKKNDEIGIEETYHHPTTFDIWGETFHLNRLQNSYITLTHANITGVNTSLLNNNSTTTSTTTTTTSSSSAKATSSSSEDSTATEQEGQLMKSTEIALQESKHIVQQLLKEAMSSLPPIRKQQQQQQVKDDQLIYLLRLTLLWSKSSPTSSSNKNTHRTMMTRGEEFQNKSNDDDDHENNVITVRGHACCNCKAVTLHASPKPIVVTIAAHLSAEDHNEQAQNGFNSTRSKAAKTTTSEAAEASIDESLPTRFANPQTKIASWCRLRRQMERPETYKPAGVSEVLMVRDYFHDDDDDDDVVEKQQLQHRQQHSTNLEVLEGLSSNFFVIYDDGTLRTPSDVVLHGYVRHLVLRHAEECGLTWDPSKPILLHDAPQKWKEAFITSSSRLIIPISQILIPNDDTGDGSHDDETGKRIRTDPSTNNEQREKTYLPNDNCEIPTGFTELWHDPVLVNASSDTATRSSDIPKWQELLNRILRD